MPRKRPWTPRPMKKKDSAMDALVKDIMKMIGKGDDRGGYDRKPPPRIGRDGEVIKPGKGIPYTPMPDISKRRPMPSRRQKLKYPMKRR